MLCMLMFQENRSAVPARKGGTALLQNIAPQRAQAGITANAQSIPVAATEIGRAHV